MQAAPLEGAFEAPFSPVVCHWAYCCPTCGQIWARMQVPGSTRWFFATRACPGCPPAYGEASGTLAITREQLAALPSSLLEREFEIEGARWGLTSATQWGYNMALPSEEPMSTDIRERIAEIRSRVVAGTVTKSELIEAIQLLRSGRAAAAKARKPAAPQVDGEAVLARLLDSLK